MKFNKYNPMVIFVSTLILITLIYIFACDTQAQDIVTGVVNDKPVNVTLTPVGDLTVVTGVVGDEAVNIVTRTDGKLIARIYWTDVRVELEKPVVEKDDEN